MPTFLGIGNTNTTGSNTTGIPLWGIFAGDHTKAYFKDEDVIKFLNTDKKGEFKIEQIESIKEHQGKIWDQIDPKTKSFEFNNRKLINNKEEN